MRHLFSAFLSVGLFVLWLGAAACGDDSGGGTQDAQVVDGAPEGDAEGRDVVPLPDVRSPDVFAAECGNGVKDPGELCDDGNTRSGDGCNSTCTLQDDWDRVAPTRMDGDQKEPALACSADRFLLVWTDWNGLDGDGASIQARLYGADGLPVALNGSEEQSTLNLDPSGHQFGARAAALPNGGFVVVWTSGLNVGNVWMRFVAPDGTLAGREVQVTEGLDGDHRSPAVAAGDDGTVLVVWADGSGALGDGSGYGIAGRLYDSSGTPLVNGVTGDDAAFLVNTITTGIQRDPDVAALDGGGFVVVWADGSGQLDGDGFGIAARVLDATGVGAGPEVLVNSQTASQQILPRVVRQPGLGAVVVWADESHVDDLQDFGIRARLLAPDGSFRTNAAGGDGDFPVNLVTAGTQEAPAVGVLPSGKFLVAWQDWSGRDGSGSAVAARFRTADGGPLSTELAPSAEDFQVDTTFVASQLAPTVCGLRDWFVVAWEDDSGQDPDTSGSTVRLRTLSAW